MPLHTPCLRIGSTAWKWLLPALASSSALLAQTPGALLTERGRFDTDNYAGAVRVLGDHAYVADGRAGLDVIDLRDPAHPVRAAQLALGGDAWSLRVSGHHALLATGELGLQIVDISQPDRPARVGTLDTSGECRSLDVVGNIAYLADHTAGLKIVNIADPAKPVLLGQIDTSGESLGVHVVDNLAYVADGTVGLQVIDVSNPANPQRLGRVATDDVAQSVHVVGTTAYVAAQFAGLVIVDVSTPARPVVRARFVPDNTIAYGVTVEGTHAYLSDQALGLLVVDVQNPGQPRELGRIDSNDESNSIDWRDGRVFLADGLGGLRVIDLRFGLQQSFAWNPGPPALVPLDTPHPLTVAADSGLPVTLNVTGPARLVDGQLTITNFGLVSVVAEQPGSPAYLPRREERQFNAPQALPLKLGSFDTSGFANGVQVEGPLAYVADGESGLQIYDLSDPSNPQRRSTYNTPGTASALQVVGTVAYVADGSSGLHIVNVANPAAPSRLGSFNTPGWAGGVAVAGTVAYVADDDGGLQILDVSQPATPTRLATFSEVGNAINVQVIGNRLYLLDVIRGLIVLDITQPNAPVRLGGFDPVGFTSGMHVVGSLAFVTLVSHGALDIYDVSDPTQTTRLATLGGLFSANEVRVADGLAYVSSLTSGLHIIDVSQPSQPRSLLSDASFSPLNQVHPVGRRLYLAQGNLGLQVLDVAVGLPQSLTWELPATRTFDGQPLPLQAVAPSGLPVTFSVVRGPATVANGAVTFHAFGQVTLAAHLAGDAHRLPFVSTQTLRVSPPDPQLRKTGDNLDVLWPAGAPSLSLESREGLDASHPWQPIPQPGTPEGGLIRVRVGDSPQQFFRLTGASGDPAPLELTGWNRDVVLENRSPRRAQAFDSFGAVWFENGLGGFRDGLPTNGIIVSRIDPLIAFQLQPYSSSNVLWLNATRPSNSLTLTRPAAFSHLYFLAHSAGGGADGTVKIHYADGTVSTAVPLIAPDWWDGNTDPATRRPAVSGLARSATAASFRHEVVPPGFSLHQTDVDLRSGPNAGKAIARIEFTKGGAAETTGIFAITGTPWLPAP